jgi:glycosyltransferase involved in cell wall biosynthesis
MQRPPHRAESTPLRVAVIGLKGLPADRPKAGGGERAIEEWFSRLALRGYDNVVYCRRHYDRRPSTPYRGVRLVSLPSIPTKSLDTLSHSLLATLHLVLFRTADIIQYGGMGTGLLAPLGKLCRKKVVVALDGIDWERPKWGAVARLTLKLGARMAFRWADAVHVDNKLAQQRFGELFGRSPELITLAAETGADPGSDSLARFGLEPHNYVLFVGLLKPDKGVHVLVEAYRKVRTALPLVIVGDSPDPGDYVRRLRSTSDDRVRFLGYVYGPDAQQLFANCLLYVQPSLMEGNSPALMTAMGLGRAVVASDIEQNLETIGEAGATFVAGDAGSLAEVLTGLIGDAREVERLGAAARERIATVYNWETSTDRLDRLYRRVWSGTDDRGARS